jgi:hypothetical protein
MPQLPYHKPCKLCTLLNCGTVTWIQKEHYLEHQTSIPGTGNFVVQKLTFIFLTCVCINSVKRTAQTEILDTSILHKHRTGMCTPVYTKMHKGIQVIQY